MPVKLWQADDKGLYSRIVTGWDQVRTGEEYRAQAEQLDAVLDNVLDRAVECVAAESSGTVPEEFLRAWAVGRALQESKIFDSHALRNERRELVWRALAYKCRTGARASGATEEQWRTLRPSSVREPRREGGRLDYFEMCQWAAEQDLKEAAFTFGGSVRNVWQMLERPTLRPLPVRRALHGWMKSLPKDTAAKLVRPKSFAEMMKALRGRWPDRGPGSAKRPAHYSEEELRLEVEKVLSPFKAQLADLSA
jgi:hypothetical protein